MKKWIYLILGLLVVYFGQRRLSERRMAAIDAAIDPTPVETTALDLSGRKPLFGENDPCAGKKRCLTVYLEPQNQKAQSILPLLRQLGDGLWANGSDTLPRDFGFRVLVGGEIPADVKKMRAALGDYAAVRDDRILPWVPGSQSFPLWILTDENESIQRVLEEFIPPEEHPEVEILKQIGIPPAGGYPEKDASEKE